MTESAVDQVYRESCEGEWLQQRQGKTLKTNRYLCLHVCQSTGLPSRDLYFVTSRGRGDCIWKTTGEVITVTKAENQVTFIGIDPTKLKRNEASSIDWSKLK
jgi:hypothetical protein